MKLNRLVAAAPACALLLTACGGEEPSDAAAPTSTATVTETVTEPAPEAAESTVTVTETVTAPAPSAEEAADESAEEPESSGEASEGQATFGDTWTWEDGTEVTVSKPESFNPAQYAFGGEGYDNHVKFKVTVENKTGEPLDVSLFYMTVQSGRSEGEEVFDTDSGMEGSPSTTLLDGRSVDFSAGFGVEDPDDLVMELTPSFEHDAAIFTN